MEKFATSTTFSKKTINTTKPIDITKEKRGNNFRCDNN